MSDYRDLMEPVPTSVVITCLQEELSRMRTALEAAEKDANRYRFLRGFHNFGKVDLMLDTMDYHTLDDAVDAAIAERALAPEGRALTAGSGKPTVTCKMPDGCGDEWACSSEMKCLRKP